MKRHVQETGIRKWFGDDLIELQNQPLKAIDEFFKPYASCVISGCEVSGAIINPGLIAFVWDSGGQRYAKVVPFAGASGVSVWPQYLYLEETALTREYQSGGVKNIAIDSKAAITSNLPAFPYVRILAAGPEKTFRDVIQTSSYRFVTDAQISNWNDKPTLAAFNSHAGDSTAHITSSERNSWNDKVASGTFNTHNGDNTRHMTAAERNSWNDKVASGTFNTHVGDTTKHLTAAERTLWNDKVASSTFNTHVSKAWTTDNLNRADVDFIARNISVADDASSFLRIGRYRATDYPNAYIGLTPGIADGGIVFQVVKNNVNNEAVIIDKNGYVGIGVKTPATKLHIFRESGDGYDFRIGYNNGYSLSLGYFVSSECGSIQAMGNNATSKLLLNPDGGYIGIGTNTPRELLHVNGGMVIGANGAGIIRGNNYDNGNGGAIKISTSPSSAADQYIQLGRALSGTGAFTPYLTVQISTSCVGIGTTSPNYPLEVVGNIVGTNIGSSSDLRWKKHIKPYNGVLSKLLQMQMVSFKWKDKKMDQRINLGYVSQNIKPLFPELILTDAHGYMSLEYQKFGVLAIEGLKELQYDVYDELAMLRKEISELRSLLIK